MLYLQIFSACLILFQTTISWGTTAWNYRSWTTIDGLYFNFCSTVEVAPDGTVLVNHGDDKSMSILDGFDVRWVPSPGYNGATPIRVIKNQTNQLWANSPDGVQLFQDEQWQKFPLLEIIPVWKEIKLEGWLWHRLPFIAPSAKNRILVLNAEQILEWDASHSQKRVLKQAQETGLGSFFSIRRALKGGYWITGKKGLAKMDLNDAAPQAKHQWQEFLFPEDLAVSHLGSFFELQSDQLFGVAHDTTTQKNVLLRLTDTHWQKVSLHSLPNDMEPDEIWPGMDNTIWSYSRDQGQLIHHINQQPQVHEVLGYSDLAVQPSGVFWLSTKFNLNRFAPQPWQIDKRFRPIGNTVFPNSLYRDPKGHLWIIDPVGVHQVQEGKIMNLFPWPSQFPLDITCSAIAMLPDGRMVISGWTDYLLVLDPETGHFHPIKHPDSRKWFRNVVRLSDDMFVVETIIGDRKNFYFELFNGVTFEPFIPSLNQDGVSVNPNIVRLQNGDIWIMTTGYLSRYRNGEYKIFDPELMGYKGHISTLFEDAKGILWAGGTHELYQIVGDRLKTILSNTGYIKSITQAKDGTIWFTSDKGVYSFKNNSWVTYNEEDGLPSASYMHIAEDEDGNIWAQTHEGIYRFHPNSDLDAPETFMSEEHNLRQIPPSGEARFVFSGKDKWKYTHSDRLYFSYRLDQQEWSSFANETVASFSNLLTGNHTFQVRAMDLNRNVDLIPVVWEFTVLRHWYMELGFLFMSTCGSLLTLIAMAYAVSRHINLERWVSERTQALQSKHDELLSHKQKLQSFANELSLTEERERKKLAIDLHDGVSQSLALSSLEIGTLLKTKKGDQDEDTLKNVRERLELALSSVQSLTFELCPPSLYRLGLEPAVRQLIHQMQKQYGMTINFKHDDHSKPLSDDLRNFLFRATRELLFNVKKHAKANNVHVSITRENQHIRIAVMDDGVGFDATSLQSSTGKGGGFGFFSIQERLVQLGGNIEMKSKQDGLTVVVITAPLHQNDKQNLMNQDTGKKNENPNITG